MQLLYSTNVTDSIDILQLLVFLLQVLVEVLPFLQRCSQDSSFGRDCFVFFSPAQQCLRVSGQITCEVLKGGA